MSAEGVQRERQDGHRGTAAATALLVFPLPRDTELRTPPVSGVTQAAEGTAPQARQLNILVAHESELVGRGLRDALEAHGHHVVLVGASTSISGADADLVMSSPATPHGRLNGAALIVLEPELDAVSYVRRYLDGAAGVVSLADPVDVLTTSVAAAQADRHLLPALVLRHLLDHYHYDGSDAVLSPRQKQVLERLASGVRIVDIAEQISYSPREVNRVIHQLFRTFEVASREELLVAAARSGLI